MARCGLSTHSRLRKAGILGLRELGNVEGMCECYDTKRAVEMLPRSRSSALRAVAATCFEFAVQSIRRPCLRACEKRTCAPSTAPAVSVATVKGNALAFQSCIAQMARKKGKAFKKGAAFPHAEVG